MFREEPIEVFKSRVSALSTKEEREKFRKYMNLMDVILVKDLEKKSQALVDIEKYTDRDMYKFCEQNPLFKSFIKSPGCELTADWQTYLKGKKCIAENLDSLDGSIKHRLYDEYMGAYLYSEYCNNVKKDNKEASKFLALACEFNLFQALRSRCIDCQHTLLKNTDDKVKAEIIGLVLHDSDILSRLYGLTGCIYAAKFLRFVGTYYLNLEDEAFVTAAAYFHRLAAACFYMGKHIHDNKVLSADEKIMKAICKDAGLGHFGFRSWEAAEQYFLEPIDKEITSQQGLYTAAQAMIKEILAGNKGYRAGRSIDKIFYKLP